MKVPKVRLYIRVRCPDGQYAYYPPAHNKNRTIRASYAVIDGQPHAHPDGVYYLRYLRGKKRVWQAVGADADAALVALRNQEHDLQAIVLGRSTPEPHTASVPSGSVAEGVANYLAQVRRFRSKKTVAACERILVLFESCYWVDLWRASAATIYSITWPRSRSAARLHAQSQSTTMSCA